MNDDSVDPKVIYDSICELPYTEAPDATYQKLPFTNVSLSSLCSSFDTKHEEKVLSILHHHSCLIIDDACTVDINNPNHCFLAKHSYLDYFMIVGTDIGVDMFIPQVPPAMYTAVLNLHLQIKEFHSKFGRLGFNPSGTILYVGSTGADDLWLAMAPDTFFNGVEDHGDCCLSTHHYQNHDHLSILCFGKAGWSKLSLHSTL
jgi:hypothetical protein